MSATLRPLTWLYQLGVWTHRSAYQRGLCRMRELPVPVVSVGNITTGGTGKTPVTLALALAAEELGMKPAILTRGYGGQGPPGELTSELAGDASSTRRFGDEPMLLKQNLPRTPILVGADRSALAGEYLQTNQVGLFLLDDGFQHWRLRRTVDLVLVDGTAPLGGERLLPEGRLREPVSALTRAGHILLMNGATPEPEILAAAPDVPRTLCTLEDAGTVDARGREANLKGVRVLAVTGIAEDHRFLRSLKRLGAEVAGHERYRDHHAFTAGEVKRAERFAERAQAIPVTTEKDWTRLSPHASPAWRIHRIQASVPGGWPKFLTRLLPKEKPGR